jgi:putative adenylate-forming enzyme
VTPQGLVVAAAAFARTRWLTKLLRSPEDVARYQHTRLRPLLRRCVRDFPFYRDFEPARLEHLPIIDKSSQLAHFAALNRAGLELADIRAALARGEERLAGYVIGQSTGTSGNRGYYAITERERFEWLGTLLAKALPSALWRRHRVALALPGLSQLYRSATSGSRIVLGFFDLAQGVDTWAPEFSRFAPDTVVSTPKVLRRLAEMGHLRAHNIFSGAEVLDPLDREVIEAASGTPVREIYMATEGLFGVACTHGTLHLAEDVVHFEWQTVAEGSQLLTPVITDFTRQAQAMIRYRMNDLLALHAERCPCGSPLQPVRSIEGRRDDVFWLQSEVAWKLVTPDVVRNAIVDASPAISDFRAVQTGPCHIKVALPLDLPVELDGVVTRALRSRLGPFAVGAVQINVVRGIEPPTDRKLRRVRRDWTPPIPAHQSQA